MERKKIVGKIMFILLVFIAGFGLIATILAKSEPLMNLLIGTETSFSNKIDTNKVIDIIMTIHKYWVKVALVIAGFYALFFCIENHKSLLDFPVSFVRNLKQRAHKVKEKIAYLSKKSEVQKIQKEKEQELKKIKDKKIEEKEEKTAKRHKTWPGGVKDRENIIKRFIGKRVKKEEQFTITKIMKELEEKFKLSKDEKYELLDQVKDIVKRNREYEKFKQK